MQDLDALLALERDTPTAPHWPASDYAAIVGASSPVARLLLVADLEASLAGFAVASSIAGESELESIVVAPCHRRQGVARALLTSLLAQLPTGVCRLEVRRSSTGAIALYRELGFELIGVRRDYYRQPAEDALLLGREARARNV